MKYFYLILTVVVYGLCVFTFKLLDNFTTIICFLLFILSLGIVFSVFVNKKSIIVKEIGWGILYGSLLSLALLFGFIIWLACNFPR